MSRLAWLGAGFAAGVAFALPRVLNLEGELEARDECPPPERPPPGAEFVEHQGYLWPLPRAVRSRQAVWDGAAEGRWA